MNVRRAAATAVAALVVAGGVACGSDEADEEPPVATSSTDTSGETGTTPAQAKRYSLAATRRCLREAGLSVGAVETADDRLRALGDLAQRSSLGVRSGGTVIGLAFGDAELLAGLLAVPDDAYVIETRGNALLLYRAEERREASAVRRCLR